MKKIIISLAAFSALSTAAFAAADDHGRPGWMNYTPVVQGQASSTSTLIIKKGATDADRFLNASQLR